jgi:hypothetical protein
MRAASLQAARLSAMFPNMAFMKMASTLAAVSGADTMSA